MGIARVLVVDDSPTALQMAVATLQSEGFDVLTATDGEEALKKAEAERPDVIVLDVILPRKNGFQVVRQLRSKDETTDLRVILLTSKRQDADRFWGLKQGADMYMTKPYAENELVTNVTRLL